MQINQFHPVFNKKEIAKELSDYALSDGFYTEYKLTEKLEKEIAKFLHTKHCFLVNNGTISLSLALLASGIKAGDRVIVPNITMIATCNAVKLIGAVPVFIDIDERNLCIDLEKVKKSTYWDWHNIKAVIYVSLNGRSHDSFEYFQFQNFCKKNNIVLIEDNAQSFGSCYKDSYRMSCPNFGIGSYSFSMPKIITTGQGGCLVTNDDKLADKIKKLKDFGRTTGGLDVHDEFGINSKFTELQAIIGLNQLKDIKKRIDKKREIFKSYYNKLKNLEEVYFIEDDNDRWTPWFIDIFINDRDKLQKYLKDKGIGTRAIYPELTSQKSNWKCFQPKTLSVSKEYSETGLWLPSSVDLKEKEIEYICTQIKEFYGRTNGNV